MTRHFEYNGEEIGVEIECNIIFDLISDPISIIQKLQSIGVTSELSEYAALQSLNELAILRNINVEPKEQGHGYGVELMGLFLDEVDEKGINAILVVDTQETQRKDFNLIEYYKFFGFQLIEETQFIDKTNSKRCGLPVMIRLAR